MRQQVTIDGQTLSYLEAGEGNPVLLVHAFPLHAEMWEPQLRAVPRGWRMIAPDMRGFGQSVAGEGSETSGAGRGRELLARSIDEYAEDVESLLRYLKIDRAVIGGLSMGGYVALALLRRTPVCVRGLILADTRSAADTDDGRARRRQLQALVDREGAAGIAREMLPKLLSDDTRRERRATVIRVREMISGAGPAAIKSALQCMMARPDSTPHLSTLRCPALIVVGAQDSLAPRAESERMHQLIEGSTLVVIPSAGHLANLERPVEFNAALSRFLAQCHDTTHTELRDVRQPWT